MASGRNSPLEGMGSEGSPIVEDFVPTPIFSGQVQINTTCAISFAPATTEFAAPMTHGTLMADFTANPGALRDWDDMIPTESFTELAITWPGFNGEWRTPMAEIVRGRCSISRAELARFVVDQFSRFASTVGANPLSSPEWRLGEAPDAYSIKNTCLAFLWSPAPGVWQPAFRVRNHLYNLNREACLIGCL